MFRFAAAPIILLIASFATPQTQTPNPPKTSQAPASSLSVGPSSGTHYTNSNGQRVHTPMQAPSAPSNATAKCRDGSYSFSQHHSGTCSHHGGVGQWLVNDGQIGTNAEDQNLL